MNSNSIRVEWKCKGSIQYDDIETRKAFCLAIANALLKEKHIDNEEYFEIVKKIGGT